MYNHDFDYWCGLSVCAAEEQVWGAGEEATGDRVSRPGKTWPVNHTGRVYVGGRQAGQIR